MEEREEATREKKTRGPEETPTRFVDIQVERIKKYFRWEKWMRGKGAGDWALN